MENILRIENLNKTYESGFKIKNINFNLKSGEFLGLIGESGSGKSTIAKIIVGLIKPSSGKIVYDKKNILNISIDERKKVREDIQMIFQNPYSSLNPKYKIKEIILEGLQYKKNIQKLDTDIILKKILYEVGLKDDILEKFPSQLSGGERQRVGIARALSMQPKILIADECLSSLDILTQTQILKIFLKIKKDFKLSCIFISHDLTVIKRICDKVIILKDGKVIEAGEKNKIFQKPENIYTRKLLETKITLKKEMSYL